MLDPCVNVNHGENIFIMIHNYSIYLIFDEILIQKFSVATDIFLYITFITFYKFFLKITNLPFLRYRTVLHV